jgi:hypothetical protein
LDSDIFMINFRKIIDRWWYGNYNKLQ